MTADRQGRRRLPARAIAARDARTKCLRRSEQNAAGETPRREVGREADQLHAGLGCAPDALRMGLVATPRSRLGRAAVASWTDGAFPFPLVMAVREPELPDVVPRCESRSTVHRDGLGSHRASTVSTTQIAIQTQTPGSSPPCLSPKSSQQPTTNREPDTEPGRLAQCEAVAGVGDDDFEDVVLDIAFAPDESLAIRIGVNHALATASVTAGPIRASTLGATPWTAAKSRTRCLMNGAAAGRASSRRLRDGTFWLRDRRLRWFAPRELL